MSQHNYIVICTCEREVEGIYPVPNYEEGIKKANEELDQHLKSIGYSNGLKTFSDLDCDALEYDLELATTKKDAWCNLKGQNWDAHIMELGHNPIEVEPVIRAQWISSQENVYCSNCGSEDSYEDNDGNPKRRCHYCGAHMKPVKPIPLRKFPAEPVADAPLSNGIPAIIIEEDYKGHYGRFALTEEEFKNEYGEDTPENFLENLNPEGDSCTVKHLVHIWCRKVTVGDPIWNQFFTDMAWGLPESDIGSGNLAYIKEDSLQSLSVHLPTSEHKVAPAASCDCQKRVKSDCVYSPQNYVEDVTGYCYCFHGDDMVSEIQKLLIQNGFVDDSGGCSLWDFPLCEIDEIVNNELNVVLVDVSGFNGEDGEWKTEYRWFEVPEDFCDSTDQ